MRIPFAIFMAFFFTACASAPKPAETVQISFVSAETAILKDSIIIISGDFSEDFEEPGYKIQLKSDREIIPKGKYTSVNFDFFQCDSRDDYLSYQTLFPGNQTYADREYLSSSGSNAAILEKQSDGSVVYEVELSNSYSLKTPPICARLWVHDGNRNRKIWHPSFVSNKVIVDLPPPLP